MQFSTPFTKTTEFMYHQCLGNSCNRKQHLFTLTTRSWSWSKLRIASYNIGLKSDLNFTEIHCPISQITRRRIGLYLKVEGKKKKYSLAHTCCSKIICWKRNLIRNNFPRTTIRRFSFLRSVFNLPT